MDSPIRIEQLGILSQFSTEFSQMDKNYIISRIKIDNDMLTEANSKGMKFDGLTIILTISGSMKIRYNTETIDIDANSLIVTRPNAIIKILEIKGVNELELFMLFLSPQFLSSINIDLNVLHKSHMENKPTPVLSIPPTKTDLLYQYMEMLHINAKNNPAGNIFTKNISRSLIAALMYQMMQLADSQYDTFNIYDNDEGSPRPGARRLTYVKEFMTLVHANYTKERSVGFYASKLCISSKYLSFIIKEVTGRSAAEWIDEYVILEAKNMLRFSGMNVQEVSYALNFNNQSAFGKYFKHLTGMSPTQFQKN